MYVCVCASRARHPAGLLACEQQCISLTRHHGCRHQVPESIAGVNERRSAYGPSLDALRACLPSSAVMERLLLTIVVFSRGLAAVTVVTCARLVEVMFGSKESTARMERRGCTLQSTI